MQLSKKMLIHWGEISQQEHTLISLWGKFALRQIWLVMQHYSLPPIHPDPSYHIPVTQPTPLRGAIDMQCPPPHSSCEFRGTWRYLFRWKIHPLCAGCFWKMTTRAALRLPGFHVQAVLLLWFLTLSMICPLIWYVHRPLCPPFNVHCQLDRMRYCPHKVFSHYILLCVHKNIII